MPVDNKEFNYILESDLQPAMVNTFNEHTDGYMYIYCSVKCQCGTTAYGSALLHCTC